MRSVCIGVVASLVGGAHASIINGGFENPNLGFRSVLPGQTYGNWTNAGPGDIEFVQAVSNPNLNNLQFSAYEGQYWIDLCGVGAPSAIYQDLTDLTPGQRYSVEFAFSANVWGPNFNFSMDVLWNNAVVGNFQVVRGGSNGLLMNWELKNVEVVAQTGNNRLMFKALTATSARGPAIDAVSISLIPSPGSLAMLAIGAAPALRRRR